MKTALFFLGHTAILAAMFIQELAPNKYVGNVFVFLKLWITFIVAICWFVVLIFKSGVPAHASINAALSITKKEKKSWSRRLLNEIDKGQVIAIVPVALLFGQWYVFTAYSLLLGSAALIKPSAEEYLKKMHIDLDKKTAVIDV